MMKNVFSNLKFIALAALTMGFALGAWAGSGNDAEFKYLEPVYKTAEVPSSGIDRWKTNTLEYAYDMTDKHIVTSAVGAVTWGTTSATSWYVVTNGTFQIGGNVTCVGHVNLVLCDGAKLTVTGTETNAAAIATDTSGSFTVYGSTVGNGHLVVTASTAGPDADKPGSGAGIGGGKNVAGKNITINGGFIEATGGQRGPGIGSGGYAGAGDNNIVINGGLVKANCSGEYGAGIGGGTQGYVKGVVINGGTVIATGGKRSAGIGSGAQAKGTSADITINGGYVVATGGNKDDTISAIGQGYAPNSKVSPTASGICVSTAMKILADDNYPPTTEIANAGVDLTSAFAEKRYAIIRMPTEYTDDCLTFSSDGAFTLSATDQKWDGVLWTSTDKATWTVWNAATVAAAQTGGTGDYRLHVRGDIRNTKINDPFSGYYWKLTPAGDNKIACTGNIETLRGATGDAPSPTPMAPFCYANLFRYCASLTSAPTLPATNLSMRCYGCLFLNCTSLTEAPALPAVNLYEWCYESMFFGCSSLTSAPSVLPAMDLAMECYQDMFNGCTSLPAAPALPATNLAVKCYRSMFTDCTSLTSAPPVLAAMTLTESCYAGMFMGCTSLTAAPALPATNLAFSCYAHMFRFCHSLTSVPPVLPATDLAKCCYLNMFYECTSLTDIPALPATNMEDSCYDGLFYGCRSLTVAPALPMVNLETNCCSSMFYGCTSLTDIPALPVKVLKQRCYQLMFCACSNLVINTTGPGRPWSIPAEAEASTNDAPKWGGYPGGYMFTDTGGDVPELPVFGQTYYIASTIATVTPQMVAHTTSKVYTNDTVEVVSPCKVPWGTPVKVVYTADEGYFFADGTTVKTNELDTAKNPATADAIEAPFIPAASVTTNGVTAVYATLTDAWADATSVTDKDADVLVTLLKDATVVKTLVRLSPGRLTLDLNDKVLAYAGASDAYVISQQGGDSMHIIDTATTRTPRYFTCDAATGLWTLTNEATDHAVSGGLLTGGRAGAVSIMYGSGPHTISNVNFVGNSSAFSGGAVSTSFAAYELKIAASSFFGNVAAQNGGAVSAAGLCEMTDCRVEANVAGGLGGGVYMKRSGSLVHTEVVGNKAGTGGGVYLTYNPGGCFPAGVKILMADGSEKNVEKIVKGDVISTFDHIGGTNSSAAVFSIYRGTEPQEAFALSFASGARLDVADCHDLLVEATRKYVTISSDNARQFVGQRFYNFATRGWDELVGVEGAKRCEAHYSIYTRGHGNCVANGMLTVPDDKDCFINVYELDENLKADAAQLAADSETYGLATTADYPNVPEDDFADHNMRYARIAIGKGLTTQEEILFWNEFDYGPVVAKKSEASASRLMMSAPKLTTATSIPAPYEPYLEVGEGTVVTGNVSTAGERSNVYLIPGMGKTPVINIRSGAEKLDVGVALSTGAGMFGWTNEVNYAMSFSSDDANYGVVYTADNVLELVPFITVVPPVVEHATAAVYDGETKFVDEPYVVLSNATEVTVVYTAEGDYFFAGGVKVVTNKLDTSKNPATVVGELPVVLEPVEYREPVYVGGVASNGIERWETKTCYNYTVVASATSAVTWGAAGVTNWFVVTNGNFKIDGGVVCKGYVNLILCKDAKLTVANAALGVAGIATDADGLFAVYGQPDGAGALEATGNLCCAGIGGSYALASSAGANITINGGAVTAIGGASAAGIGGGLLGNGVDITINGGVVTAVGTLGGAGIGGGCCAAGSDITINDGKVFVCGVVVNIKGQLDCPDCIGNGTRCATAAGDIVIGPSAKVFFNLSGLMYSDGFNFEWLEPIAPMPTDFDGFVIMTPEIPTNRVLVGGVGAQGLSALPIFSLTNAVTGATGTIEVNGEKVLFAERLLELPCADNALTLKAYEYSTINPPDEIENTTAKVYANDAEVAVGAGLVVPVDTPAYIVYTADGDYFFEDGLKVVTNKLDTSTDPATVVGELPVVLEPVEYVVPTYKGTDGNPTNGIAYWTTNKCYNYTKVTSEPTRAGHRWGENGKETWLVVEDSDVVIADYVRCFGHVHLILCDGADLKVTNGIRSDSNALTIYAGPEGTGELTAESKDPAAGIGCGHTGSGNNVTINGGRITATGGKGAAGIGGGYQAHASNIVINAGIVTATGNGDESHRGGAGIGGGAYGAGRDVVINGGTVTATGSLDAAGIGGGCLRNGTSIVINGGKVTATGGSFGAGIGGGQSGTGSQIVIRGGEVLATAGTCAAGIGGGSNVSGIDIAITGGKVQSIGGWLGAGIGGGAGGDGERILIDGCTVTAVGGCLGAGIGGGQWGGASDIAIGDATVFVGTVRQIDGGIVSAADVIGCGHEAEEAAEDVTISESAKIFFNLTGCYDNLGKELIEEIAPMPAGIDGFVIMTPELLTANRVLVGGFGGQGLPALPAFALTNSVTEATDELEIDGAETTFARTFCSLTNDNGKLTLVIRKPVLTVTQLPDVANGYAIDADTDGNNGITNYAWCMQKETTTGFVALTNALEAVDDELGLSEYGDIEETAISSYYDNDDEVHYIKLYWLPADNGFGFAGIPRCGKLYFTCASDISGCYEETIGSVSRIGVTDEWVWEAKVADIGIELYALLIAADASFKIDNLRWVADEFVTVAQGPTMTVLPPDVAMKGSNYVCRMDYGHEGFYYTDASDEFTCLGYPIPATPTEVAHTTFEVYTNGVLSTETEPGAWAAWSNETAEVVYVADEGYAFADGSTVKTNKLDTLKNPAVNKTVTEAPFGRFTLKFDVTDEVAGWTLKTNGVAVSALDELVLTNGDVVAFAFTRDPKFFYETETDCGEWTGDSWSYQVAIGGDETHELKVTSKFGVIKVVYKAEGGAWSDGLTVSNVVTLISGGYAFPEAPVREGSNFIGWFDGATNGAPQVAEAQELLRMEEHALHAKWESVTIDPEGGEDALEGGEASSGRKDETAITGGKKSVTDADGLFVVPDVISNGSDGRYVTEIGKGAFAAANYSFGKIKALITPRYLTRICAGAFYQQRELRSLAIAASVDYNDTEKPASIVIERQAFAGTALETVLIPSNVVEIADNAFLNCADLAKIVILGDGANLKIGAAAFARCGEASEDGITVYVSPEFLANHPTFAADVAAANPSANVQVTTASPATSAAIGELQVGENGMVALVVTTTVEVPGTLPDVAKIRLMHSVDLSVFGEVTEDVVKTAFADGTVLIEFPKPEGASGYWKIELGK